MMVSPFGPSVMLLSRFGRVSRNVVAFQWNGVFVLLVVPLLLLLLAVFAVFCRPRADRQNRLAG